jgi:hypothetical protein
MTLREKREFSDRIKFPRYRLIFNTIPAEKAASASPAVA